MKVPIKKGSLEYGEWGRIIEKIEDEIEDRGNSLRNKPRGKPRSDALMFNSGIMGEFNAFKDVWRNAVMHSHGRYNHEEALGVFRRVEYFMKRLAERVKEA
jgi:hypothetical protein